MSPSRQEASTPPVVFGDVSVARYPEGDEITGGHAFAIAWHLRGLGWPAVLITRVGDDPAGQRVVRALEAWDAPTAGVQRAAGERTGVADVSLDDTMSRLADGSEQPWDRIGMEEALVAARAAAPGMLVHGTRCLRSASNRRVLERLVEALRCPVYFDLSHEPAVVDDTELARLLARSRWLTVQQDELGGIGAALGCAADDPARVAARVRDRFALEALFVTDGVNGAFAVEHTGARHAVLPDGEFDVIDRTGIRPAFSAAVVHGLLAGWTVPDILGRAQGFVELIGALPVPAIPSGAFYEEVSGQWQSDADRGDPSGDSVVPATPAVSREARLPAELEQAVENVEELRGRRALARMRAAAVEASARQDGTQSRESVTRARRSLDRISERVEASERELRRLEGDAEGRNGEDGVDDGSRAC